QRRDEVRHELRQARPERNHGQAHNERPDAEPDGDAGGALDEPLRSEIQHDEPQQEDADLYEHGAERGVGAVRAPLIRAAAEPVHRRSWSPEKKSGSSASAVVVAGGASPRSITMGTPGAYSARSWRHAPQGVPRGSVGQERKMRSIGLAP